MEVRDSTGNYSTEVSYVHDSTIPALIDTVNAENSNPFTPEYLQEQEHKDKVATIYYEDYEHLKTLVEFPAETYYEDFASFHFAVENVRLNLKNKVHPYSPFFLFRLTQYKCLKCGLIVKKTGYKIVETQKLCGIKGSHLREETILSGEEAARMTKLALRRGAEAARVSR